MANHKSLSVCWSPQVSRTLLIILVDLNSAIVWMVSICPLISNSSRPFISPLVTVPSAPITIGITHIFTLHTFFCSLASSRYWPFFSLSFNITLCSAGTAKFTIQQILTLFFFFCLLLGLVIWPRLGDPFVSQNHREVGEPHSPGQIPSCTYTTSLYGQIWICCSIPSGSLSPDPLVIPSLILFRY